jgi:hypothetical protein
MHDSMTLTQAYIDQKFCAKTKSSEKQKSSHVHKNKNQQQQV